MEYTKYAAVGHFKCHRTLDGKKYPVVIVGRKEYMLDVQEMTVWSSLAWRILSRSQIAEAYLKLTRGLSFTSRRTLDDPDASLPTPVCTDHAHFSNVDTSAGLTACKKHYRGVAKLGIDALVLKAKGFDCKDIAALYHTSSNNVGAWISRAAKKLRSDPDFLDTFDIAC